MPRIISDYTFDEEPFDASLDTARPLAPLGRPVPNKHPIYSAPYRLAIIGEAPGKDEEEKGEPFVGMSGRFLSGLLSKVGIIRDACFIGNVCQHRPPGNDISNFNREADPIQSGLSALASDLDKFNPNCCLLLGKTALWAAKGIDAIGDWRGSFFLGTRPPFLGRKCIAAYHPAACLRQYEWTPLLLFDIKKAKGEAGSKELILPSRQLDVNLSADEIIARLEDIYRDKVPFATDIEGYVDAMRCISLATSPHYAFMVPFMKMNGDSYWPVEDEVRIWRSLSKVLSDPLIPKTLQNALYDTFVLQYSYRLIIRNVADDTMLKSWELYCELEKALGFLCSLFTSEPFYKSDRRSDDLDTFHRYGCRDSAVTKEISGVIGPMLDRESVRHYSFNIDLLNIFRYMEIRGIRYDSELAAKRREEVNNHIDSLQGQLDDLCGFGVKPSATQQEVLDVVAETMCYKRSRTTPKAQFVEDYPVAQLLAQQWPNVSVTERGHLNTILSLGMNIKSPDFKKYLYETLNLPVQYAKDQKTGKERPSANYEALLKLSKKSDHKSLPLATEIGTLRTRAQMLEISSDRDGRIRCGYNCVGTETGRITCYTSPTGSGYNLQTIPSEDVLKAPDHPLRNGMRDLFIADRNHYIFQCDLSGADGWTVAAYLASLGDPTMLDDYKAGVKPAKVLCYMLRHGPSSLAGREREEVKHLTKEVTKESWDYFACKIGQHMTCYRGGARKLANVILMQSEGKVDMSEKDVKDMQNLFFIRYRVKIWWDWAERYLTKQPYPPRITSPSGHTRRFFGRREEILGEFLAHLPQSITTYATNLAAHRLWFDPENREGKKLIIEPLHQIHDALLGEFTMERHAWAVNKIKQWFDNPIKIAGIPITIPFEGAYGTNWALDEHSKVGSI